MTANDSAYAPLEQRVECDRPRRQCVAGPRVIPASQWTAELASPSVPTAYGTRHCPHMHCVTLIEPGAPGTAIRLRFDWDAYRLRMADRPRVYLSVHQYNDDGGVVDVDQMM